MVYVCACTVYLYGFSKETLVAKSRSNVRIPMFIYTFYKYIFIHCYESHESFTKFVHTRIYSRIYSRRINVIFEVRVMIIIIIIII